MKVLLDYLDNLATALGTAGNFEKQKSKDLKDSKQAMLVSEESKTGQIPSSQIYCEETNSQACSSTIPNDDEDWFLVMRLKLIDLWMNLKLH